MAFHSLLQRRFAPRKVVHLPSLFPVLFHNAIPDRFFTPFKNDGRYLVSFCKKPFSVSAHAYILFFCIRSRLPLPTASPPPSPTSGDGFFCVSFRHFGIFSHYFHSFVSAHTCPFRQPVGWHFSQRQSVSLTFAASLRSSKSGSHASRHPRTAFYISYLTIFVFVHTFGILYIVGNNYIFLL